ncbi:MAG: enoyl-CoA hydratase [Chloroflexota bacterium]|nr:MAG: enoyl-CoA hydratase [Chloroflexota bacterium]
MSERPLVTWTAADGVAVITLDNPPRNTLGWRARDELIACLDKAAADEDVRVVVITGAGERFFCAGAEVTEFPEATKPGKGRALAEQSQHLMRMIDELPKPTICAINGYALGAGCLVAIACDLRIAAENAQLGLPEIKLGVFPGGGGTQRLPRLIGESKAKELLYGGNVIDAQEAHRIGLANRIVATGRALSEAQELAAQIASYSGPAVRETKEAVHAGREVSVEASLSLEVDILERVFQREDALEGFNAFLEKRPPRFRHR